MSDYIKSSKIMNNNLKKERERERKKERKKEENLEVDNQYCANTKNQDKKGH